MLNLGHFIGATQIFNQKWDISQEIKANLNMHEGAKITSFQVQFSLGVSLTNHWYARTLKCSIL